MSNIIPTKYRCIDYNKWDNSGTGVNLLAENLLLPREWTIWNKAFPLQDKRDDSGHAEIVSYFAVQLLKYLDDAKREIVVPAAILHDIGWSGCSKEEIALFYAPDWQRYEPMLRALHQKKGVELAKTLFSEMTYAKKNIGQILDIISEHDTRVGFISKEDGIVRDADKLWRYTVPCINIALTKRKYETGSLEILAQDLTTQINKEGFFYSQTSRDIASLEMNNSFEHIIGKSAERQSR